jgi:hypothetical protein
MKHNINCLKFFTGEARACEERARNAMLDAARLAGKFVPKL